MGRTLKVNVVLSAPPGDPHGTYQFTAGDTAVPDWAAGQLGDHCWEGGSSESGEPPRAGKGSGRDAWAAFADGKVEVADDDSRDAIIGKLEDAGHIAPAE